MPRCSKQARTHVRSLQHKTHIHYKSSIQLSNPAVESCNCSRLKPPSITNHSVIHPRVESSKCSRFFHWMRNPIPIMSLIKPSIHLSIHWRLSSKCSRFFHWMRNLPLGGIIHPLVESSQCSRLNKPPIHLQIVQSFHPQSGTLQVLLQTPDSASNWMRNLPNPGLDKCLV